MDKIKIVGVNICSVTLAEAKDVVEGYLDTKQTKMIFTPNSEILMQAVRDKTFADILNEGDLVTPDGIGVVIASKFYKKPMRERVAGYDLMCEMLDIANRHHSSVYFIGAKPGVAELAKQKVLAKHPNIIFKGVRDGYFKDEEIENIINEIGETQSDMLFMALGAPKQERLIYKYKDKLGVKVAMGVGGSFDVLAGTVQRAPEIYQKLGLEWFYRFLKQPSRIGRLMDLPKFIFVAIYDAKFKKKIKED